jgi:hypothetical protein
VSQQDEDYGDEDLAEYSNTDLNSDEGITGAGALVIFALVAALFIMDHFFIGLNKSLADAISAYWG